MEGKKKGKYKPKGYWRNRENRRNFFTSFAKEAGFDPLVPSNWAKVTHTQLSAKVVTDTYPHSINILP